MLCVCLSRWTLSGRTQQTHRGALSSSTFIHHLTPFSVTLIQLDLNEWWKFLFSCFLSVCAQEKLESISLHYTKCNFFTCFSYNFCPQEGSQIQWTETEAACYLTCNIIYIIMCAIYTNTFMFWDIQMKYKKQITSTVSIISFNPSLFQNADNW